MRPCRISGPGRAGLAGMTVALMLAVAACSSGPPAPTVPTDDVAETLAKAGRFNAFLDAVRVAGLGATLRRPGGVTVFAPTDAAFAQLPRGVRGNLMASSNREQLRKLVLNHFVEGRLTRAALGGQKRIVRTEAGFPVEIDASQSDKGLFFGRARVTGEPVEATNGLIHAVDRVVRPLK